MTGAHRAVASPRVVSSEDLRPIARRRVPKAVFDYLDGGAKGEITLRANCRAFEEFTLRPRSICAGLSSEASVAVRGSARAQNRNADRTFSLARRWHAPGPHARPRCRGLSDAQQCVFE